MAEADATAARIAQRHGLSVGAIRAIQDALRGGRGNAQWDHPDLGGGMLQIGDMFNHDLKARVAAAVNDLVEAGDVGVPEVPRDGGSRSASSDPWWPVAFGAPA